MAKEFKRSGSKDFKGKKPFSSKKEGSRGPGKKSSFGSSDDSREPFAAFRRDNNKESNEKKSYDSPKDKDSRYEKKTPYNRSGDNARPAKDFKKDSDKEFKNDKSFETKKARPAKNENKPSFERFRDDSRPSDFGGTKKRSTASGFDETRKRGTSDKPGFKKRPVDVDEKPSFRDKGTDKPFSKKTFSDKPESKKRRDDGDEKPSFRDKGDDKPRSFSKKTFPDKPEFKKRRDDGDEKPSFRDKGTDGPKSFSKKPFSDKPEFKKRRADSDDKPSFSDRANKAPKSFGKKTFSEKPAFVRKSDGVNPNDMIESDFEYGDEKPKYTSNSGRGFKKSKPTDKKTFTGKKSASKPQRDEDDGLTRLNKYLSNAGICSRREADELIASGVVQVNGKNITEMGYRVKPTDIVKYGGQTLKKERLVYLILNKPKDYITTADDPQERRTVLELVQGACKERIYPVGRLDRATTGLLMFTNDGDLTKKLTHPRYGIRKIYHVELDKPLKRVDLDKIAEGLELEDGPIKVDEVSYVGDNADKTQVGVEIHSGKNRIVRRIFEHMGYNVRKLDRVMFGSLTKKDLPRGRWRILSDAEVGMLKMISTE